VCTAAPNPTGCYQDRLYALLNILALHAVVLALSVAW
jgi:hypothetical protein